MSLVCELLQLVGSYCSILMEASNHTLRWMKTGKILFSEVPIFDRSAYRISIVSRNMLLGTCNHLKLGSVQL